MTTKFDTTLADNNIKAICGQLEYHEDMIESLREQLHEEIAKSDSYWLEKQMREFTAIDIDNIKAVVHE